MIGVSSDIKTKKEILICLILYFSLFLFCLHTKTNTLKHTAQEKTSVEIR